MKDDDVIRPKADAKTMIARLKRRHGLPMLLSGLMAIGLTGLLIKDFVTRGVPITIDLPEVVLLILSIVSIMVASVIAALNIPAIDFYRLAESNENLKTDGKMAIANEGWCAVMYDGSGKSKTWKIPSSNRRGKVMKIDLIDGRLSYETIETTKTDRLSKINEDYALIDKTLFLV